MTAVAEYLPDEAVLLPRTAQTEPLGFGAVALILAVHVPLALLMAKSHTVGLVHAWGTLLVGLSWAFSKRPPLSVGYVAGYLAGAEVLWRMTSTPIFWEFGKYAVIVVLLAGSRKLRPTRDGRLLWTYFILLLPSVLLTVAHSGLGRLRHEVSFNLSGPLALAVCGAFFAGVEFTPARLQKLLVAVLAPIIAIWSLIVFRLATSSALRFDTESNFETSGGFGPNQVSAALGFGALAAILVALLLAQEPKRQALRWIMLLLALALAAQSALTFSRSGVYLGAAAALTAVVLTMRQRRARTMLLTSAAMLFLFGNYLVLPWLDDFTGGKLSERFRDTGLTGRDRIMKADVEIWMKNPFLGIGPGLAAKERKRYFKVAAAHTEPTRMLAEHGVLGLFALGILARVSWSRVRTDRGLSQAVAAALIVFAVGYMFANGMRTVLPSCAFGLALARLSR